METYLLLRESKRDSHWRVYELDADNGDHDKMRLDDVGSNIISCHIRLEDAIRNAQLYDQQHNLTHAGLTIQFKDQY